MWVSTRGSRGGSGGGKKVKLDVQHGSTRYYFFISPKFGFPVGSPHQASVFLVLRLVFFYCKWNRKKPVEYIVYLDAFIYILYSYTGSSVSIIKVH